MASYNTEHYIKETIRSIQSQTYNNWELIITDDCSPDNSNQIIQKLIEQDSRIILLKMSKNSGPAEARNNSIRFATGRYIAFCDSDDLWLPEKLEKQIKFMERKNLPLTYCSSIWCKEDGEIFGMNPVYPCLTYKDICNCDKIGMSGLIYDTHHLQKIYFPTLKNREDWALKIKILEKTGYAIGMFNTLFVYRFRKNSFSSNKIANIKYNVQVYHDILGYSYLKSWLKFIFNFAPCQIRKIIRQKICNSNF